jgi:signal transduction histidine kinase/ABC-type amino acid transport substrate-binding protein/ActR/RegA family two-component response regulator
MKSSALFALMVMLSAIAWCVDPCLPDSKPILITGSESDIPYFFRNSRGEITGIFVDFWRLWASDTGNAVAFEAKPYDQLLEDVQEGRADVMAAFHNSPDPTLDVEYSIPFYEITAHIFFHEDIDGPGSLDNLSGFTIGIVKDAPPPTDMLNQLPTSTFAVYDNFDDLISAVAEGEIKVFIGETPAAIHFLLQKGLADHFRHSSQPLYAFKVYAGVRKNNIALLERINQGIVRISMQDWLEIDRRWLGIRSRQTVSWAIISTVLVAVVLMIAGILLWNNQVRRRIAEAAANLKEQQRRLEASEKSLQRGNEQLEQRVQLRTLQIQKTNLLLADQIDRHAKTEKRLAQHNAYLSALHETVLGLMRRLDQQELLEAIIQRATTATGTRHGYVYLKDGQSDDLVCRIGTGLFATAIGYRLKPSEGLAGKVLKSGRYILVEDYHNWEGRHPESRWDGLGTVIGIPLTSGAQVVGVLGLSSMRSENGFGRDEIAFLNGFAELASIALDNARLYQDLQNELAERKRNEAERTRLEKRIRHAQKMEAIGTLAGGIAHDFNNILAVIMGNMELAMQSTPPGSQVNDLLQDGFQASIRARDLIQQILTFGRKGNQGQHPMRVEPVIAEGIKLIRASIPSSIDIRQHLTAGDTVINASPVQIHQVLINLSANAAHAMEDHGGVLEFTLTRTRLDDSFCGQHPDISPGEYVQLSVSDSGHGIAPAIMPRIFEPYFTTKTMERGTGLGLSVVHGIVKSHQGLITARSVLQRGTVFDIYLPICQEQATVQPTTTLSGIKGTESILFVDDEPVLVKVTCKALISLGYQVTACANGSEALDRFKAAPDQFDLVITDMTMPRMNGDKLAVELLKLRPDIPIIICTGFSHQITMEKANEIGIRSLLMKPVFLDDLTRTLREILDAT